MIQVIKKQKPSPKENVFSHNDDLKSHLLICTLHTKHVVVFQGPLGKGEKFSLFLRFSSVGFTFLEMKQNKTLS